MNDRTRTTDHEVAQLITDATELAHRVEAKYRDRRTKIVTTERALATTVSLLAAALVDAAAALVDAQQATAVREKQAERYRHAHAEKEKDYELLEARAERDEYWSAKPAKVTLSLPEMSRVRWIICIGLAWGFGTFAVWQFADWPWIAAAFNAPLWGTLGAVYAERKMAGRGSSIPDVCDTEQT